MKSPGSNPYCLGRGWWLGLCEGGGVCRGLPVRQGQGACQKKEDDHTVAIRVGEEIGDEFGKAD